MTRIYFELLGPSLELSVDVHRRLNTGCASERTLVISHEHIVKEDFIYYRRATEHCLAVNYPLDLHIKYDAFRDQRQVGHRMA